MSFLDFLSIFCPKLHTWASYPSPHSMKLFFRYAIGRDTDESGYPSISSPGPHPPCSIVKKAMYCDSISRKTLFDLNAVLSASFGDYDFSHSKGTVLTLLSARAMGRGLSPPLSNCFKSQKHQGTLVNWAAHRKREIAKILYLGMVHGVGWVTPHAPPIPSPQYD